MSQTGQQIITIHMLSNISGSKDSQAMQFGHLIESQSHECLVTMIEYNMRDTLFENPYTKYGGRASPRPFHKKSKLIISLYQQSEIL